MNQGSRYAAFSKPDLLSFCVHVKCNACVLLAYMAASMVGVLTIKLQSLSRSFVDSPRASLPLDREMGKSAGPGFSPTRQVLFTGCGYSGTGFLSKLFTSAGYPVGHECLDVLGVADWRRAFGEDNSKFFKYILTQVRHPLSVVHSWEGTRWEFSISRRYNCEKKHHLTTHFVPEPSSKQLGKVLKISEYAEPMMSSSWKNASGQIKALEWWYQANERALSEAHLWWRLEDFNSDTALAICLFVGLPNCQKVNWATLISLKKHHNTHIKKLRNKTVPSWDNICGASISPVELQVCIKSRMLCRLLGYQGC